MMQRTAWILFQSADGQFYCPSMPVRIDGFTARDLQATAGRRFESKTEAVKAADRLNGKRGWLSIFFKAAC